MARKIAGAEYMGEITLPVFQDLVGQGNLGEERRRSTQWAGRHFGIPVEYVVIGSPGEKPSDWTHGSRVEVHGGSTWKEGYLDVPPERKFNHYQQSVV